jgi:DNA-binding response OmpR family regulator
MSLHNVRVFLTEENEDLRSLFNLMLKRIGVGYPHVVSGKDADRLVDAAAYSDDAPTLVLLDIDSPAVDGLALCRRLRESGYTGTIVALTHQSSAEVRDRSSREGFTACHTKPHASVDLRDIVLHALLAKSQQAGKSFAGRCRMEPSEETSGRTIATVVDILRNTPPQTPATGLSSAAVHRHLTP